LPTETPTTLGAGGRVVVAGAAVVGGGGGGSLFLHAAPLRSTTGSRAKASLFMIGPPAVDQPLAGIFSFWPGKILFGSLSTSVFASKMRFHSLPFP
jgi:hypothetical protein